jgi:hypothetical protein
MLDETPGLKEAAYKNKTPGYNVEQHSSGYRPTVELTGFQRVGGSVPVCKGARN